MGAQTLRGGPTAIDHDQRLALARQISDRLRQHYQDRIEAIGIFGSVAREMDGPYSDVELFCVLKGQGIERAYEWATGPWKALVNVCSEDVILRDAAVVDGTWPLVQSGYVFTQPLYDPNNLFPRVREIALGSRPSEFRRAIRDLIVGELYEAVGKARNARDSGSNSLPILCVEMAKAGACLIALSNRHLYSSPSTFLDESIELPNRPDGYDDVCKKVISGELGDFSEIGNCIDRLWAGIESWAEQQDILIYEDLDALLDREDA